MATEEEELTSAEGTSQQSSDLSSNAGYQLGSGARSGFKPEISQGNQRFKMSKKKAFFIGGAGLGGLIGIGTIIFFLLLFKNIHIKNLFMDYEFAKFNRAFRNRLEKSITESQPTGDVDTVVDATATPVEQMAAANATEVEKLKTDVGAKEDAIRQLESLDQSTAGSGGAIDGEWQINRSLSDETGKTDAETTTDINNQLKEEASQAESTSDPPNQAARDAASEADNQIKAGAVSGEAFDRSITQAFARGLNNAVSKLQGPFVFATFLCIARDIFATPGHVIQKVRLEGLANQASFVAKTADCQKQGKCSMGQISAVASKFDGTVDGKSQSFTNSCGSVRASGQVATPGKNCTDLDENLRVDSHPTGIAGTLVNISNNLDGKVGIGPLKIGAPIGTVCNFILDTRTQVAAAGLNILSAVAASATGVADFGASDVATAAAQSAAAIFATKAGQALAVDAALHYGGNLFKQNFTPIQWGNIMDAGMKARAANTCRIDGCPQLTPDQNTKVSLQIHADMVREQRARGLAYRLFSPENPISTAGLLADRMPSTPQTALATIGNFFATTLNPERLAKGFFAMINPAKPAWAADTTPGTYGIPDYGFTDTQLNQYGVKENSDWVQANMSDSLKAKYDKCFSDSFADIVGDADINNPTAGPYGFCNDGSDVYLNHYRLYKFDQRVTHDLVLLYNNQPEPDATQSASSGPGLSNPGSVYIVGDSLSVGTAASGLDDRLSSAGWPTTIHGAVGRSITGKGMGGEANGLDQVDADKELIAQVKNIVIILGTNPENNFQANQAALISKLRSINGSAKLFWVNVGATKFPAQYSQTNQIITSQAAPLKYSVIDWYRAVFPGGDPTKVSANAASPILSSDHVHPNSQGYLILDALIFDAVTGGGQSGQ